MTEKAEHLTREQKTQLEDELATLDVKRPPPRFERPEPRSGDGTEMTLEPGRVERASLDARCFAFGVGGSD